MFLALDVRHSARGRICRHSVAYTHIIYGLVIRPASCLRNAGTGVAVLLLVGSQTQIMCRCHICCRGRRYVGIVAGEVVAFDLSVIHIAWHCLGALRRISFNLISFSSHLIMTSILIILGHFLIMHDSVSCSWEIPNYVLSCGTHLVHGSL